MEDAIVTAYTIFIFAFVAEIVWLTLRGRKQKRPKRWKAAKIPGKPQPPEA